LQYILLNLGCTQSVCLKCCDDDDCEAHKEQRDQALFREQVLGGTSLIQREAKYKRSKLIAKGRFREPGFCYMGDTVIIWNLREYLDNPKWKEDALRKSSKRKARSLEAGDESSKFKPLANSRKRFRRIMEELYQNTLQESSS
jgi:hypothetical protein